MTEYTQEPVECPDGPAVYRVYGAKPGSKTNFVVAKLYVYFLCNENTDTVNCISTTELPR